MRTYTKYLTFVRFMNLIGLPLEDRMSYVEFEAYEKKVLQSNVRAGR